VHGIVFARGKVGGRKVAFVSARTTYFHEADSALGFSQLNDPGFTKDPQSFQQAASNINFGFNWSYVDADHIAYYQSGWYPQRAPGTSPDFPILGTGEYDWQGYDPSLHTTSLLPFGAHPQAIDPPYLVSWNNKQAPGWAAADDQWAFGPLQRMQMIEDGVKRGIAGGKKMTLEQLVSAMEEASTEDIRAVKLLPAILKSAYKPPKHGGTRAALAMLKAWAKSGGHRRDLNKDGHYDDDQAVTLMDHWWPALVTSIFRKQLGTNAFKAVANMITVDDETIGSDPSAPAYETGWWGYVSKDLRDLFNPKGKKPRGRYSRVYCGGGNRRRCRNTVLNSLRHSLEPAPNKKDMYGHGKCASDPEASCFDMNRPTIASGVDMPDFPLQNRPTFQQTIELMRKLPRP
jgi:acyl-homoserine lactone acylase PvdQ